MSERLIDHGWSVHGLSRGRTEQAPGVRAVHVDLTDPDALSSALESCNTKIVFFTDWSRQATEVENIRVNGGMVANVLRALGAQLAGGHVGLVTGLKHYLGPFEAYGNGQLPQTPFKEEQGRLPVDNFYYEQEDRLFEAAALYGFGWSVHRPHTIIGYALGNTMNMGVTLAVYATICQELGTPMQFPGSEAQWNGVTDMTDAGLLAAQLEWAATRPSMPSTAMYSDGSGCAPASLTIFGVPARGFEGSARPLEIQMRDVGAVWERIATREGLRVVDVAHLVSWWHTDADLGRPIETFADMSKSRLAGFLEYRDTLQSFRALFDRLKDERVIPAIASGS